ncbi:MULTISPECIES: aldo/keto reductase [Microbacterium]|uniref:aldo/keto reductase n=1 Tax=Microbacterium TaxID=33882 RepID=UPI00146ABF62|nr:MULTISPECIES: aldo/keto reductase [Microbacterium]
MIDRRLLSRGLALTEVGLGTAQLGNLYRATTDEDARAAVDTAWGGGVRYFDTAPHYGLGLAERRLGQALRARSRSDYIVSTKVGRLLKPVPGGDNRMDVEAFAVPATHERVWDFSRDGVLRSVENSLARLGLDSIDIAFLHDPDHHESAARATGLPALIELRDEGAVRAVGVAMNQVEMPARFIRDFDVDVVMIAGRYTLLDQGAQEQLLDQATDRQVGVIAAAVYNSGLLSTDVLDPTANFDYAPAQAEMLRLAARVHEICQRYGTAAPSAAVQFPLRHPAVVSVVAGARDASQVDSMLARYHAPIPEQLWAALETAGVIAAPAGRP